MLHMICNSYFRKRWMELVVNPPGKLQLATHIDPLIELHVACLKLLSWMQSYGFRKALPRFLHLMTTSLKACMERRWKSWKLLARQVGSASMRGGARKNQPLRASKRSPAFALTVQSITSTLCTFENNLWNIYIICHCILCINLNTHLMFCRDEIQLRAGGLPCLRIPVSCGDPAVPRPGPDPYLPVELMAGLMRPRPLLVPSLMTTRPLLANSVSTPAHSTLLGIPQLFFSNNYVFFCQQKSEFFG